MTKIRDMLELAYLAGFSASGEGWNGEYPFEEENPLDDAYWTEIRDEFLAEILAELFAERSKIPGARAMTATIIHFLPDRTDLQRSPTGKEAIPSRDSHPVRLVPSSSEATAGDDAASSSRLVSSPASYSWTPWTTRAEVYWS